MAEYLIQDTTLDAIADAINAKTGKTAPMTPVDMVSEIQSIPTGGGWELVAEATTTEDVEAFRVDIPKAKQNMTAYLVEYDCTVLQGTGNAKRYGCPRLNSIAVGQPYALNEAVNQYQVVVGRGADSTYRMILRTGTIYPQAGAADSVEYVAFVGYFEGNLVAAGSTIKVYGIGVPS